MHVCNTNCDEGSTCHTFCGLACTEEWGVPCVWQLIANMEVSCAGSFSPVMPTYMAERLSSGSRRLRRNIGGGSGIKGETDDAGTDCVDGCSVHALMEYCGGGNSMNENCAAVLKHYDSETYGLAMMALKAINDDWSMWCSNYTR